MRKIAVFLGILSLLTVMACRDYFAKADQVVVAECYGNKLYLNDLEGVVPAGEQSMDSLSRVNAFIDSWIRRQLLLHQAEKNLSDEQRDFSKQIEEYRNALMAYAYESQVVEQYLDTIVDEQEIADYYEQNKDNFQLRSTMVKVAYVIIENDCKHKKDFQQVLSNRDTLVLPQLDILATHFAVSSFLDVDTWVRFDDLLEDIPLEVYNTESFLKKNKFVTFERENLTYMIRFEDYIMKESVSPLEIEYSNIKSVILMKRKMQLLSKMKDDLYEKAMKEHAFEIY